MTSKIYALPVLSLIIINSCYAASAENLTEAVITNIIETDAVERITVTATRQETLDTDLGMSVQAVGKEELALDNGQHVAASLNSISGVLIDQLSGGQGHKTAIRMPMNTSGYYLYLQDNIPLQSAAFFNHNALWWSSFNSNVASMEVLKGAGTALYGSGAVAATVNILSADVADSATNSIGVTLGEDKYTKIQLSKSKQISETQGVRLSGSYLKKEGWREHTASERVGMTFRHELALPENERLVTSLIMSYLEQEMAGSLDYEQYQSDITNSGLTDNVLNNDPLRKTQYMRLSSQWDKTSAANYYSLIPYYRYRTNDYTATWNDNMPIIESTIQTLGLLALTNIEHNDGSNTTVGVDVEYTQGDQSSYQPLDITTTGYGADTYVAGEIFYDDTTTYIALSPYIQHQRALTDNLDLTLGARYDYSKYYYDNHFDVYGDIGHGNLSIRNRSDNFSHFSPKASLNYHLTQDSSLYARYANSFRLPSASSIYHLTTDDDGTAKAVDPEVSDTFELGYKANWQSVNLETAVYYMDVDDGIVSAYNDSGQRYYTNATRVIHKGAEISLSWKMSEQYNLSSAYSRSKHIYDDHDDYSGNELAAAPDYIANIRFRYTPNYLTGFSSMLELQSIGEYWLDDDNSLDEDGYSIANLKIRYQISKALSLHSRILNITDEKYIQEASYQYGSVSISPGAPRTAYIGLDYQW